MEKDDEPGIFRARTSGSYQTFLQSVSVLIGGIFLGHLLSRQHFSTSCNVPVIPEPKSFSATDVEHYQLDSLNTLNIENSMKLESFSEHQYACNTRGAYEELTNLHKRSKDLDEHKKRGEANRSRQATIVRKADAARAAEHAFRECVSTMMPELLNFWDESLKKGDLNFHTWSEEKNNGITLALLEDTADTIDKELKELERTG